MWVTVGLVAVVLLSVQCTDDTGLLVPDDVPVGSAHHFFRNHKLTWQDTFDGTTLDASVWRYDTDAAGNREGWGNQELQYYTANNATVANGSLTIEARRESMGGKSYTSSRIHTHGTRAFQYGIIEAQLRMPSGTNGRPDPGIFPAFWLLGDNFNGWGHGAYGGDTSWPQSGEIDVAEVLGAGGSLYKIFGTAHWHEPVSANCLYEIYGTGQCSGPTVHSVDSSTIYSDPHIYTIVWNENTITWYFDYKQYAVLDIRGSQYDEFREEFFVLFNFAVGGNPAGNPVPGNYPQSMVVDWVRHYCSTDSTGACIYPPTINTPTANDVLPVGSAHQVFDNHKLTWQDAFEGTSLDTSVWRYDTDAGGNSQGWGNGELQFYTNKNATVANGSLTIEARRESMGGKGYTSSRIHTHGAQAFQYGIIEAQLRMPSGTNGQPDPGIFPAFWLLGDNFNGWGHGAYGGDTSWPQSGEIDVAEVLGSSGSLNKIFGTAHWHEPTRSNCLYSSFSTAHCSGPMVHSIGSNTIYSQPHIYSIVWNQDTITWYFDHTQYATLDIRGSQYDEFREEFFILLNFAVGGNPAGNPVPGNYPQRMVVDWVRHYCPTDSTGACTSTPTVSTPQESCAKAASQSCPTGTLAWVYGDCSSTATTISNLEQQEATDGTVTVSTNANKGALGTAGSLSVARSGGVFGGAGWKKSSGNSAEDLSGYTNLHFSYCLESGVSTSSAPFFVKVESSSSSCNEYTPTGLVADGTWKEVSVPVSTLFGASNGGPCTTAPSSASVDVPFYLFLTGDGSVNVDEIYYK